MITGASSGIGEALAKAYARKGIKLILIARNKKRLEEIANYCISKGAEVLFKSLDLRKKDAIDGFLSEEKIEDIDLIIASAGVSAGTLGGPESQEQINTIFETNLFGTINTIIPVAHKIMIPKKAGHIAVISSMAGMIGLPSSPSYSASKSSIKILGDALRSYYKNYNITVSVIIPGYVETPMTKVNDYYMPFLISAQKAANIILQGLHNKRGIIVFPKIMYFLLKILNLLPYRIVDWILAKLPGKTELEENHDE